MNRRRAGLVQVTPKVTQPEATSRHRGLSGPRPLTRGTQTPEPSTRYSPTPKGLHCAPETASDHRLGCRDDLWAHRDPERRHAAR